MTSVAVYWEDQYGKNPREFGPHNLLLSCLCDHLGGGIDPWFLGEFISSHAAKGDAKLFKAVERDAELLTKNGDALVAVYDFDQIHELFKRRDIQLEGCKKKDAGKLNPNDSTPGKVKSVFLVKNLESIAEALLDYEGATDSDERRTKILSQKKLIDRDEFFSKIAFNPNKRATRDRLMEQNASWRYLVLNVAQLIAD